MIAFLNSVVPIKTAQHSKRMVSQDFNSNITNNKYTVLAEISPICRDDLVCLPKELVKRYGGGSSLFLCTRVTSQIRLIDPLNLRTAEISSGTYFRYPFPAICNSRQLVEYIILDVHPLRTSEGKWSLARVECARSSDFGVNDTTFECVTHIGHILKAGDLCLGYDVTIANFNDNDLKTFKGKKLPDIVLVRKIYPRRYKRKWRLKQLTMERQQRYDKKGSKDELDREDRERERFLQQLEEDPDMRKDVNIYRIRDVKMGGDSETESKEDGDEEDRPMVKLEEMLDDMSFSDVEMS
eukprot:TRINITY_DN7526_c0_g1_i1.p1 TRINITY_DN7526_c0_g1~~TRINITY_DN7526_c0_g1_i1.p1  ORF type:complete len:296 (+),score=60.65 TRINITY_DN7526_c0_g1_i1:666-1553(+)